MPHFFSAAFFLNGKIPDFTEGGKAYCYGQKNFLCIIIKAENPLYRRKNSCHKGDFLWQEKQYEKEIFELKEQGLSQRQIGERLGISYEKMQDFFNGTTEINEYILRRRNKATGHTEKR